MLSHSATVKFAEYPPNKAGSLHSGSFLQPSTLLEELTIDLACLLCTTQWKQGTTTDAGILGIPTATVPFALTPVSHVCHNS